MPCIDGEGKPVIKESPYSDEQGLSQRESISLRSMLIVSGLALSVSLRDATARVAAPRVCFAVACILLAAAPTAPPCFRRWRRSSPLPPEGEPLASRSGPRGTSKV